MLRSKTLGALIAFVVGIIAGSIGCQTASGLSEILLVDNGALDGIDARRRNPLSPSRMVTSH